MFQQRGIRVVVFSEVCPSGPVAEPVQLQTAARVRVYSLEEGLIGAPRRGRVDGLEWFGRGL